MTGLPDKSLAQLARLWGIQPAYRDATGQRREVSPDALLRTLQILGAGVYRPQDAPDAVRRRRQALWQQTVEPVVVAWDGLLPAATLRVPISQSSGAVRCSLQLETGEGYTHACRLEDLPSRAHHHEEGVSYAAVRLDLARRLSWGYHRLVLELHDRQCEVMIIAAPLQAYAPPAERRHRLWGVFLPLYALWRQGRWGAGDFSDLQALTQWVARQGGRLVGTLPLLASLWELTGDPSPYSPASRLFWNEFYLDVRRVPEFASCPSATAMLDAADSLLGAEPPSRPQATIDYSRQIGLKRKILEALAEEFFTADSNRRAALDRFCHEHPEGEHFARFRAVGERQGRPWQDWPEPLHRGIITPGDFDRQAYRYHLYAQWQVDEQLQQLASRARQNDLLWYLDFPLGVSRVGYDVWRHRDLFALEASGGAPPDAFFTKGQNWAFPPLHPQQLRAHGYAYLIDALRTHLRYAGLLRVDHVMCLERLYWIPEGMDARDGVYVRYPREELFAVLTLESHRHQAQIVGENLGTVPEGLDEAMRRHGVAGMHVLQFALQPDEKQPLHSAPATSVASVNTHDMPPFAAFWTGLDVDDRLELGLLTDREADQERDLRARLRHLVVDFLRRRNLLANDTFDTEAVLEACLALLASSPAPVVLVNLEDLWQETQPQNTPGTWTERPNWRRRARYSLEEFSELPAVLRILRTVDRARRQADTRPPPIP